MSTNKIQLISICWIILDVAASLVLMEKLSDYGFIHEAGPSHFLLFVSIGLFGWLFFIFKAGVIFSPVLDHFLYIEGGDTYTKNNEDFYAYFGLYLFLVTSLFLFSILSLYGVITGV